MLSEDFNVQLEDGSAELVSKVWTLFCGRDHLKMITLFVSHKFIIQKQQLERIYGYVITPYS